MTVPADNKNYNPLTCCMRSPYGDISKNELDNIPPWFKQHLITLLSNYVDESLRDDTGYQAKAYRVRADYMDVEAAGAGGGIETTLSQEQWVENQVATFYVDKEPGATVEDALLFNSNIFVIKAVEESGLIPVMWEIHCVRRRPNIEEINNLELQILALSNAGSESHYAI